MTKRTKSRKITCPCCGKERSAVDGTSLPQLEDKLLEANLRPWWNSKEGWSIEEASKGKLQWACRYCLKSGRAIEANPVVQKFCDYPPYLAYFDVPLRCEDCGSKFVFEAKEQALSVDVRLISSGFVVKTKSGITSEAFSAVGQG